MNVSIYGKNRMVVDYQTGCGLEGDFSADLLDESEDAHNGVVYARPVTLRSDEDGDRIEWRPCEEGDADAVLVYIA